MSTKSSWPRVHLNVTARDDVRTAAVAVEFRGANGGLRAVEILSPTAATTLYDQLKDALTTIGQGVKAQRARR